MQSSKLHTAKEFCELICQICSGYLFYLFICIGVLSVYLCTTCMLAACRDLKRVSDPLELKLQMVCEP